VNTKNRKKGGGRGISPFPPRDQKYPFFGVPTQPGSRAAGASADVCERRERACSETSSGEGACGRFRLWGARLPAAGEQRVWHGTNLLRSRDAACWPARRATAAAVISSRRVGAQSASTVTVGFLGTVVRRTAARCRSARLLQRRGHLGKVHHLRRCDAHGRTARYGTARRRRRFAVGRTLQCDLLEHRLAHGGRQGRSVPPGYGFVR